jgi:CheY-like chemotaxis protein
MGTPARAHAPLILVVDDDHDTADVLCMLLKLWGYRPVVAYDGDAALRAAQGQPLAAAVIDLAMPGLDGCQLVRYLRAFPECDGTLLIAATGYGRDEDRRRCRESGFHHHLLKPYNPLELRRLLPPGLAAADLPGCGGWAPGACGHGIVAGASLPLAGTRGAQGGERGRAGSRASAPRPEG